MSSLLKSGAGRDVRRFAGVPVPEPVGEFTPGRAPEIDLRDLELARLEGEVVRLNAVRKQDAADAVQAIEAARAEGLRQGLAEAETREADRLLALNKMLRESTDAFAARLEVLDALAPALARTALAKLFDNVEAWAVPVEAMLARQLATLRRSTLVAVRVSPQDFPDAQALIVLSGALGLEGSSLTSDRELRAGASRIECRLGQIDLDAREQWQALSALLEDMSG